MVLKVTFIQKKILKITILESVTKIIISSYFNMFLDTLNSQKIIKDTFISLLLIKLSVGVSSEVNRSFFYLTLQHFFPCVEHAQYRMQ